MLQNDNGEWLTQQEELDVVIQQHFKTLLSSNGGEVDIQSNHNEAIGLVLRELHLPTITPTDVDCLLKPLTQEEVKDTLFTLVEAEGHQYQMDN